LSSGVQIQSDSREHNRAVLKHLPYKFKGIIASSLLLPGERVESVVYQPTIWRAQHRLFRLQQAAAMVLVLTNMHVLVVHDERSHEETSNGMIARYYPLSRVIGAEVQLSDGRHLLNLRAGLGEVWESHALQFEPAATAEVDALLAAIGLQIGVGQ
jgi:hypothetical protein